MAQAENACSHSAARILLAMLRLQTGSLWWAIGFHIGWSMMQEVIFGPVDGAPSLRPLELHGPPKWIGRPATPTWAGSRS